MSRPFPATARRGSARSTAIAAGASRPAGSTRVQPQPRRIVSYDDVRLAVADNSESADVTVELVDVGAGTQRSDYAGKDVRGKLVLCDATPSACHRQAVEELGAAGLVSYNSNQVSAWWRDDQDLIRWGHLDSRGRRNAFAIMISVREARALQQRLARGERITLHAVVRARNDDSSALRDAGGDHSRRRMPRPETSCSAATSITKSLAPTTTPAAAPPTSRSRAR